MNAEAESVADMAGSGRPTYDRSRLNTRRLLLDLGFTGLLIAALIYGALYFYWTPAAPGQPQQSVGLLLLFTLLPIGILALLSLIERLVPPAGPRKSFRSWLLHYQINVFLALMFIPAGVLSAFLAAALSRHLGFRLGLFDLEFAKGRGLLGLFGAAWVSAVVGDFFFYWSHRALHKSHFLWQHHKMHHMDPELEAVTNTRQNWIEAFLQILLMSLPLAILFKTDALDAQELGLLGSIIAVLFGSLLGLGHMNVRLQVGWASLFFCSPQIHRIHHSRLPQHHDKNFAFVLPLWDVLFGTYYAPARDEFPPCGVDGETEIQSFWESQIFTQREWWKMFRAWRRRRLDSAPG